MRWNDCWIATRVASRGAGNGPGRNTRPPKGKVEGDNEVHDPTRRAVLGEDLNSTNHASQAVFMRGGEATYLLARPFPWSGPASMRSL